jgi:hypothetical protein
VLEWSLLSDTTMHMDGLPAAPHNNAGHYYVRDNCTCGETFFYSYELLQFVETLRQKVRLKKSPVEHMGCYRGRRRKSISGLVNGSSVTDYTLRYRSSVQVNR